MIRAKMSLLLFSIFVAVWVFIPARSSRADSVKTEVQTSSSSSMDSPQAQSEYQYKREHSESHVSSFPGDEEKTTEVETSSRSDSDTDLATPSQSEQRYEYKSEKRESSQVSPPPVVEHDRTTVIEREIPAPPREGRLQAWWHRNIHRDDDDMD